MRATAVVLGLLFGIITVAYDGAAGVPAGVLIGSVGIIAAVATWIHPRAGLVGFLVTVVVALLASLSAPTFLTYVVIFGVCALLAWRSARRNRSNAERAERMDRYVRSQLGE